MEKKTMGSFMAALRKANGLTQQQVADRLNVSNKTVSKWECDDGYPEITILPAIAELYGVTVDELLRGERAVTPTTEGNRDTKSEATIKYLIEKSTVRFTNSSVISIVLGVIALVLAYTIGDIVYNYNVLWVGYVIILVLCGVSTAIALVAFNNFASGLHNENIVEKDSFECNIKKCIKNICIIAFLTSISLLGLVLNVIMDGPSFLFAALPATVIVGGVVTYFVRSFLYKKYKIEEPELTVEQKLYRKKHIKITSIILCVVVLVSIGFPFVGAIIDGQRGEWYCFPDGVGYQYATVEEASNEYYKLKEYVTDGRRLYNLLDYSKGNDAYVLTVEEILYTFEKSDSGYALVETVISNSEEIELSSYEAVEKFIAENVYDDENLSIGSLQKNVEFDDETMSVRYKWNTDYFGQAMDILSVFVIGGSCVFIVVFIISVAVYYSKKKKLCR